MLNYKVVSVGFKVWSIVEHPEALISAKPSIEVKDGQNPYRYRLWEFTDNGKSLCVGNWNTVCNYVNKKWKKKQEMLNLLKAAVKAEASADDKAVAEAKADMLAYLLAEESGC